MKAKTIKEGFLDDPGNLKALSGYAKTYLTKDYGDYVIEVKKPFTINVTGEDRSKLQYVFNKYKVPYVVKEMEKEISESELRFSDGMKFDTSGPLRPEQRSDGWYVVGNGLLVPVDSEEEAEEYINNKI